MAYYLAFGHIRNFALLLTSLIHLFYVFRKLSHPHVVKFYGTSLLWENNSVRIVLVLEYCKDNLRSYISKNHELIPGKSETKRKAIRTACQWVKEITDALAYIHDVQSIVHRDVKLENILVRWKFVIFCSSIFPNRPTSG